MFFYIFESQPLLGFYVDQFSQEIFVLRWHFPIDEVETAFYFRVKNWGVVVFEGQFCHHHGEEDYTQRPYICQLGVIELASDHLGRGVAGGPAGGYKLLFGFVHIGQSEINYFQFVLDIQQHILRFNIPMRNPQFMKILQPRHNLIEIIMRLRLIFAEWL